MKKVIMVLAVLTLFAVPMLCVKGVYGAEQDQIKINSNRSALKDMTPEQRAEAMMKQRNIQKQEMLKLEQKRHEADKARYMESLNKNKNLTNEQREKMIKDYDDNFNNMVTQREALAKKNDEFFMKITSDKTMTPKEKNEAIREYLQKQQAENKKLWDAKMPKPKSVKKSVKTK